MTLANRGPWYLSLALMIGIYYTCSTLYVKFAPKSSSARPHLTDHPAVVVSFRSRRRNGPTGTVAYIRLDRSRPAWSPCFCDDSRRSTAISSGVRLPLRRHPYAALAMGDTKEQSE